MKWPDASLHDRFNGTSADQLFFSLLWLSIVRSLSHSGCHASLYSQGKPSHLENMNVSKLLPELHSLSLPVQVVSLITRTSHHMEQTGETITVAEYIVADSTAQVVLKVEGDQIKTLEQYKQVRLVNARTETIHGHLRLVVDSHAQFGGSIEPVTDVPPIANIDSLPNMSDMEFTIVS